MKKKSPYWRDSIDVVAYFHISNTNTRTSLDCNKDINDDDWIDKGNHFNKKRKRDNVIDHSLSSLTFEESDLFYKRLTTSLEDERKKNKELIRQQKKKIIAQTLDEFLSKYQDTNNKEVKQLYQDRMNFVRSDTKTKMEMDTDRISEEKNQTWKEKKLEHIKNPASNEITYSSIIQRPSPHEFYVNLTKIAQEAVIAMNDLSYPNDDDSQFDPEHHEFSIFYDKIYKHHSLVSTLIHCIHDPNENSCEKKKLLLNHVCECTSHVDWWYRPLWEWTFHEKIMAKGIIISQHLISELQDIIGFIDLHDTNVVTTNNQKNSEVFLKNIYIATGVSSNSFLARIAANLSYLNDMEYRKIIQGTYMQPSSTRNDPLMFTPTLIDPISDWSWFQLLLIARSPTTSRDYLDSKALHLQFHKMNISQLPDKRIGILCFQISSSTGLHILSFEQLTQLSLSYIRNGLKTFRCQLRTYNDSYNVNKTNASGIKGQYETNVFDSLAFLEQDSLFLYQFSKGYYCSSMISYDIQTRNEPFICLSSSSSYLPKKCMTNCVTCFDFLYLISNKQSSLNNLGQKNECQPSESSNSKILSLCKRFYHKVQFCSYVKNNKPTSFSIYVEMGLLSEKQGTVYKDTITWPENMEEPHFIQLVTDTIQSISNSVNNMNKNEKSREQESHNGKDIIAPLRIMLQIPTLIQEFKSSTPHTTMTYTVTNPYISKKKLIKNNKNNTKSPSIHEEKLCSPNETLSCTSVVVFQQDKDEKKKETFPNRLNIVSNCISKEVKESFGMSPESMGQIMSPQSSKIKSIVYNDNKNNLTCRMRSETKICSFFKNNGVISQSDNTSNKILDMTSQKEIHPKKECNENCEIDNFLNCEKRSSVSVSSANSLSNGNSQSNNSIQCNTKLDSTGIDLDVLAELPPRLRSEIRMEMILSQRKQSSIHSELNNREKSNRQKEKRFPRTDSTGIDLDVLYQLPPNIRSEIRISSLLSQRIKKNDQNIRKEKKRLKDIIPKSICNENNLDEMNRLGIDIDVLSQLPQSIQSEIKNSSTMNNLYLHDESQSGSMNDIDRHGIDLNVLSQLPPIIRSEVRANTVLSTKSEMKQLLPNENKTNLKKWFTNVIDICDGDKYEKHKKNSSNKGGSVDCL